MALKELFSPYCNGLEPYQDLGVRNVSHRYEWPKKGKPLELPEWFGVDQLSGSSFQRNVQLKELGPRLWNTVDHRKLADWIVSDWGGIRGNKQQTIDAFVSRIDSGDLPNELKGVATYSKIVALVFPEDFCIYDARVAVSLNCIQMLDSHRRPGYFFPYLPSQNKKINSFIKKANKLSFLRSGWKQIAPDMSYATYNALLSELCHDHSIETKFLLEMSLFIDCEDLIELADRVDGVLR
jgi:hypothetical protein